MTVGTTTPSTSAPPPTDTPSTPHAVTLSSPYTSSTVSQVGSQRQVMHYIAINSALTNFMQTLIMDAIPAAFYFT